jgi:hypothetical protein
VQVVNELSPEDANLLARAKKQATLSDVDFAILERMKAPLLDPRNPPKTQDDVHAARIKLLEQIHAGTIASPDAAVLLRGLKETSEHIEMFGGEEGSEGGSRVLRLLPGMTLVERVDLAIQPLRFEELSLVQLGEEDDLAHGIEPPPTMEEGIVRYLGKPRSARTIYNQVTQDPEGLRFYGLNGVREYSFAELKARAQKRWARLRKEDAEREKNPQPVVDDGELPLDLQG